MKSNRIVGVWLLLAVVVVSLTAASSAQFGVGISVRVGPPALPVYAQPICPGPGYMWTPGYWGWNDAGGYYWIPGTWVVAPVGMLWTPGYWGWGGGLYAWHGGYWGPHVGFYGGINYGYGYGGVGFAGGEWRGGGFYYNRAVSNVSVTNVTNVYSKTVVVEHTTTTSFNGGEGGVQARPTPQEEAAEHEPHTAALAEQTHHEELASQNHENFASENHGRPAIAATSKAGDFSSHSAIPARAAGGEYHAPAMSPQEARGPSTPNAEPAAANKGTSNNSMEEKGNSNNSNEEKNANSASEAKENTSKPAQQNKPKANNSKPASKPHKSSPPPHKEKGSKEDRLH
jgi:WXXGXW repeat (2 copies)